MGAGVGMQGFLFKQGKMISNWKRRWFQVMGNKIYYYKMKPADLSSEKPLGFIVLDKSTLVKPYDSPLKQNKVTGSAPPTKDENCRFSVTSPGRTFYLIAENEREMHNWVQRLNQLLSELYNIPNPTQSPTPQQTSLMDSKQLQQQQQNTQLPTSPRSYTQPSMTSSSSAAAISSPASPRTNTQPLQPSKSTSQSQLKPAQQQQIKESYVPRALVPCPSQEQLQSILPQAVLESVLKETTRPNSSLSPHGQQSIASEISRNVIIIQQLLSFLSESSSSDYKPQYESLCLSIQDFEMKLSSLINSIESNNNNSSGNENISDAPIIPTISATTTTIAVTEEVFFCSCDKFSSISNIDHCLHSQSMWRSRDR